MSIDARIRLYDKIHGELVAEGMDPRAATREIALKFPDVNAGRNAAVTEQAQTRVVGRFDGGRATMSRPGEPAGAPAQAPELSQASAAWTGGDPIAAFDEAVARAVAAGASKKQAIRGVVVGEKPLHAAYLQAYNERFLAAG